MSEWNIMVPAGESRKLLTAGKYCDRDIRVTAGAGGSGKTYNIALRLYGASGVDIYYGGYKIGGLSDGDNPGTIYMDGAQCVAVFVPGGASMVAGTGCVSTVAEFWLTTEYGSLVILGVSGDATEGTIDISGY